MVALKEKCAADATSLLKKVKKFTAQMEQLI